MTKTTLTLLAAGCLAAPLAQAAHPSFDCSKATHEVEQIICKDADLAALDQSLAELYATLMKNSPASEHARAQDGAAGLGEGTRRLLEGQRQARLHQGRVPVAYQRA